MNIKASASIIPLDEVVQIYAISWSELYKFSKKFPKIIDRLNSINDEREKFNNGNNLYG
jgi:hypothetical protein